MMSNTSRLIIGAYIARSVYMITSMIVSSRSLRARAEQVEPATSQDASGLTVIIPALSEQAVMPRSLACFANLATDWPQLRVLVVTAAREAAQTPPGVQTTDQLCQSLAAEHNRRLGREVFHVVSYPGQGRRASQLNYAVKALDAIAAPSPDDYIAVFDADAVPDARLGAQFTQAAAGRPAMIQQPMLAAFPTPTGGKRQAVMAGQDLAAFRRTIGIEYRRIRVAGRCAPGRSPRPLLALARPMVYGVGSGLIIRRDKIEDIGFFQEPHDDLAVGHRLSMAGEPIAVLPSINIVEPYCTVQALARALSSVAFANIATRRDYQFAAAHDTRISRTSQRLLAARALADGAAWAVGPPIVAAAALHLARHRQMLPLAAALLTSALIEPVVARRLRGQLLRDFQPPGSPRDGWQQPDPFASVATYTIQPAVSALGPWLLGLRAITAAVTGRELRFTKTEHFGETPL
jgi:hypothetical protein